MRRLGLRCTAVGQARAFTRTYGEAISSTSDKRLMALQQLGREELFFLLEEVANAGERHPKVWKAFSKRAQQEISRCSMEELCRVVRALCKAQYCQRSLLNAVKRRLRSNEVRDLPAQSLAQLVSDLRRLDYADAGLVQELLQRWRFLEKLPQFNGFELSLLLVGLARASMRDEEMITAIGGALREAAGDITPSVAAGALYALALLDCNDDTGEFLVSQVVPRSLGRASLQELVNISFALVVLDLPAGELLSFSLQRLASQAESLDPKGVHALRIVAHCVKYPEALQLRMRSSYEAGAMRRSVIAMREVLTKTSHVVVPCPPLSSKIQQATERYFQELSLPYLPEQAVGPYVADFLLPKKVVLEVDGGLRCWF